MGGLCLGVPEKMERPREDGEAVPGVPKKMQRSLRGWKGQVWGYLRD